MAAEDFDIERAFEAGAAFLSNPFGFVVQHAAAAYAASERDDVGPLWLSETSGWQGCDFTRPVTFTWPQDAIGLPAYGRDTDRLPITPRTTRRPLDKGNPNKVCVYTEYPGTPWAELPDLTGRDPAAVWYNRIRPSSDLQRTFRSLKIDGSAPPSALPSLFGGGSFDIASGLLELQNSQAGFTEEELLAQQFHVSPPGSGLEMTSQTYNFVNQQGVRSQIPIGLYDPVKEVQAIRACEAQPTGGVGTWNTVNCYESLMVAAGFPVPRANAAPADYFKTGLIDPALAPRPAVGSSMPFDFGSGSILSGGTFSTETTSAGGGIVDSIFGGIGDFIEGAVDLFGTLAPAVGPIASVYAASQQQAASPVATGGGGAMTTQATTDAGLQQLLANPVVRARLLALLGGASAGAGGVIAAQDLGLVGAPGAATGLFRQRTTPGFYTPSRVIVNDPNGVPHVFAHLGRATRGSREQSVMRRLAKQNGFKVARYGSGGCRRRKGR